MSGPLSRVRAWYDDAAPRERLLVTGVGILVLVLVVLLGVIQPAMSASTRAAARVAAAEQELQAIRGLETRFSAIHTRLAAVEERIRSGPKGEIFTALESMASQSAVKVASMEPRTSPANDDYRETKVQVGLKGVSLTQLVNYLHRIESAPQLLSIKSLRIRTRPEQELLDVTFTVSSFEPIG